MTNTHHIFCHFDSIYVLDFTNMLCWAIENGDSGDDDPITALDIKRKESFTWCYRLANTSLPFQEDSDPDWTFEVENRYRLFVKELAIADSYKAYNS